MDMILPQEVILAIFRKLTSKDLCNVILVSKYFFNIGTDSSLWTRSIIDRSKLLTSSLEDIGHLFDIPRFKTCQLDLSCSTLGRYRFRLMHILRQSLKSNISVINLSGLDLIRVPRNLLGEVVSRSTKVKLNCCQGLRPSKLLSLFLHCSKSTTLQHFELNQVDLKSVPVDLLKKTMRLLKYYRFCSSVPLPLAAISDRAVRIQYI